jgi:hypothetical protein
MEAVESPYDSDSNVIGDFNDDLSNPSTKVESFESLADREGDIWFIKWW